MMKKLFLLILMITYCIIFSDPVLPLGDGTEENPYLIASLENLLWVSTYEEFWLPGLYYIQTDDIDASETQIWNDGAGFSPIGSLNYGADPIPFQGNYNGDDHTIEHLFIYGLYDDYLGLFGYTDGAMIESVRLLDVNITGNWYVGGIAGYNLNTQIINCFAEGNINADKYAGILAGYNFNSPVNNCNTSGYMEGNYSIGGLLGYNELSSLEDCFSDCTIEGGSYVGGLVGRSTCSTITACYAEGSAAGSQGVGGLIGFYDDSQLIDCYGACDLSGYSFIGGIAGIIAYESSINGCYYDYESVLINDEHLITEGALSADMYEDWINNDMNLQITDYLTFDGENYLINDISDLQKILAFGENSEYSFLLTADLDLTEMPNFYIPVFSGSFNGAHHTINGLNVHCMEIARVGLFGYTEGAYIANLSVTDLDIVADWYIGGLVGDNNYSVITGCNTSGNIYVENSVSGGLVGRNSESTITKSYSNVAVSGGDSAGGLIAIHDNNSVLNECYAAGDIDGSTAAGGLIGQCNHSSSVSNCYSTGSVEGSYYVGGLIGENHSSNSISNSYSMANVIGEFCTGGFFGWNSSLQTTDCLWNIDISGQSEGTGGGGIIPDSDLIGATILEMQMITTYTDIGWDFVGEAVNGVEDIWDIDADINNGIPFLNNIEITVSNDEDAIQNSLIKVQNYPNPFNPITNIRYELAKDAENVIFKVYNIKGQEVDFQVINKTDRGKHIISWNGEGAVSGFYFYQIRADDQVRTGKMLLLK